MPIKLKRGNSDIDIEDLITQVAKAVAEQMAAKMNTGSPNQRFNIQVETEDEISIDETIIPVKVDTSDIEATNISEKLETKKTVDSDLKKSKNKLASLLKNKGK